MWQAEDWIFFFKTPGWITIISRGRFCVKKQAQWLLIAKATRGKGGDKILLLQTRRFIKNSWRYSRKFKGNQSVWTNIIQKLLKKNGRKSGKRRDFLQPQSMPPGIIKCMCSHSCPIRPDPGCMRAMPKCTPPAIYTRGFCACKAKKYYKCLVWIRLDCRQKIMPLKPMSILVKPLIRPGRCFASRFVHLASPSIGTGSFVQAIQTIINGRSGFFCSCISGDWHIEKNNR